MGMGLFSQGASNSVRGHGLKMHRGRFSLDLRRNFFTEKVVEHWSGLNDGVTIPGDVRETERGHGLVDNVVFKMLKSTILEVFPT